MLVVGRDPFAFISSYNENRAKRAANTCYGWSGRMPVVIAEVDAGANVSTTTL